MEHWKDRCVQSCCFSLKAFHAIMRCMNKHFLKTVKTKILETPGLSVRGLAKECDASLSTMSRMLDGKVPYRAHYTPIIREYIGIGTFDGPDGHTMAIIDFVELRTETSLEDNHDIATQFTVLESIFPAGIDIKTIRLVRVPADHCAPEYQSGDLVFIDMSSILPEPPGVFLIWSGLGYKLQLCEHVTGSKPAEVRMTSINPKGEYAPAQIKLNDAVIKGRVIGKISMTRT